MERDQSQPPGPTCTRCEAAFCHHIIAVVRPVLTRAFLVLSLVAVALMMAAPGLVSMPNAAGMTIQELDHRCSDCPPQAPANHTGTKALPCSSMAGCYGNFASLPPQDGSPLVAVCETSYTPEALSTPSGNLPAPEPFPPRSIVLA